MPTLIEYALLAGASYRDTRPYDPNKFPTPDGWIMVSRFPQDNSTGFEAATFGNGIDITHSSEIVISFAGTYDKDYTGDWVADAGLASGFGSDQLLQAAEYYLQVKAANPGANITLTGHSLGGGLAALIGVFFEVPATTFDQAPFALSAELNLLTPDVAANLRADLAAVLDDNGSPVYDLSSLDNFLVTREINGGIPNSDLISNIRVDGEFLSSSFPSNEFSSIGSVPADVLSHGPTNVAGGDLHSQALLTAMLQSGDTATSTASDHTLGQVTYKLTDLLGMIFDGNLYSYRTDDPSHQDFLERLVQNQAGIWDSTGTTAILAPDAMVTRFTADLWKLAQNGGMTMNDGNTNTLLHELSDALIAFAMQYYYEDTANAVNQDKQLFTDLATAGEGSNGIRFDLRDVSKDIAAAMDANAQVDLVAKDSNGNYLLKGYKYFEGYLAQGNAGLSPTEKLLIKSMLPALRDWYVQAGASGMVATDTLNRGAFMLGGAGNDALAGGTAADLLVGNAGDDVLQGGGGSDVLLGGSGNDTYVYTVGDGLDTILDTDGQGSIVMDGQTLAGGDQYGDALVHRDAAGHTYADVGNGNMVIDGNIRVDNWQAGQLGLNMTGTPLADAVPATGNEIDGDPLIHSAAGLVPGVPLPAEWSPTRYYNQQVVDGALVSYDVDYFLVDPATGSPTEPGGPAHNDTLTGSSASDHIISGGGVDTIYATQGGNDFIEAGGGPGYNSVTNPNPNATFSDYVEAGGGNDTIYGDNGNLTGAQGNDYLDGGDGNDTLSGAVIVIIGNGASCAVLFGGEKYEAANDSERRMVA